MSRIPASPEFDPRIADWLEADPDHAPAEVLATVLAAFPSIPQRRASRVPRRFPTMNRFALFGAAAAIVVAAGLGGLMLANRSGTPTIGNNPTPSPTPIATPSPTPSPTFTPEASPSASGAQGFTESYASDLYGYGLRYPATWTLTPGTLEGRSDYIPDLAEGRTDFYGDTMSGHGLMITSGPVSTERTDLSAWSAFIADEVVRLFGSYLDISACQQSTRALTVAGEPANERDFICPDHDWLWVTTVHNGRAYQIAWLDDGGFDSDYLRPFLDRFLQTFTFTD